MSESNVDLKGLQQQVAEKKRLEAKLQELYTQQEMLEGRGSEEAARIYWNRPS